MNLKSITKRIIESILYRGERASRQINQAAHKALYRLHPEKLNETQAKILTGLRNDGTYITSIDELTSAGFPNTKECFEKLKAISTKIKIDMNEMAHSISGDQLMEHSDVIKWGLNEPLLDLIENYIGLPPVFRGVDVRCNFANGRQTASRYWHKDSFDTRIVTVIIHLRDVGTDDGPYSYIPINEAKNYSFPIFNGNRVTDEDITKKIPLDTQIECTGLEGTIVITDNCSCWHRGKTGTNKNRYTAFYVYHSAFPLRPDVAPPNYSTIALKERHPELTGVQQRALSSF